jgi:predicted  nucleic acid-binding Zn-ribbon protein
MPVIEKFTTCGGCPAPISCDIRSACDRAPPERTTEELLAEITGLRVRQKQLQDELAAANGSLIASREEARQLRAGIDRMEAMKDYATTKAFHEEQASAARAPAVEFDITEREANIAFTPMAELGVTAVENEAFNELCRRIDALAKSTNAALDDMAAQINRSFERVESAYLTQQGRINTAHDKLDAMRAAL